MIKHFQTQNCQSEVFFFRISLFGLRITQLYFIRNNWLTVLLSNNSKRLVNETESILISILSVNSRVVLVYLNQVVIWCLKAIITTLFLYVTFHIILFKKLHLKLTELFLFALKKHFKLFVRNHLYLDLVLKFLNFTSVFFLLNIYLLAPFLKFKFNILVFLLH